MLGAASPCCLDKPRQWPQLAEGISSEVHLEFQIGPIHELQAKFNIQAKLTFIIHTNAAKHHHKAIPRKGNGLSASLQDSISVQRCWVLFAAKCSCVANQTHIPGFPRHFPAGSQPPAHPGGDPPQSDRQLRSWHSSAHFAPPPQQLLSL